MSVVIVYSPCISCGKVIGCNPNRVPSVVVNGKREPVCKDCIERANPARVKNGLEPIIPHRDAYEGIDESEVIWT